VAPVTVPGGIGAHKWRDRRLLDALSDVCAPATPLLVDLDGGLLESAYANVFVQLDGALRTPPADGRILPGILRERLLEDGLAAEAPLTLADLDRAEAILLGNALRGLVPALPAGAPRASVDPGPRK
jgi:para-aminobenzoate synthetase/4-amino-4-deoxychorismate lyase